MTEIRTMEDLKQHIKLDKEPCVLDHTHDERCLTSIEKIKEDKNKKKDDTELTA